MSISDVCRLCLAKNNLVWVFDKRFESSENMKDVVYITTGVEIDLKDIISQKICEKCCQVTIKMFEFRRTSLNNDVFLREQCKQYLMKNDVKIPNTQVTIKYENQAIKEESKQVREKPAFKIHPSVRELFKTYPQIRLPTVCLKSHIAPVVAMPMDDVETYFKTRNLDFKLYTKLALKSGRVVTKKTSAHTKFKESSSAKSSNSSEAKGKSVSASHIKINSSSKGTDKISDKTETVVKDKFNINFSNKGSAVSNFIKPFSKDLTTEKTSADKKRKFSEVETTPTKENVKKPTLVESLGLLPVVSDVAPAVNLGSPAYVANVSHVSHALHICDICNSVQYSAKDLRKHQNKHLRCQFCKTRFRNLGTKNDHVEYRCIIKNIMKNLPDVALRKIEYNSRIRRKYPDAFVDFPPIQNCNNFEDNNSEHSNSSIPSFKSSDKNVKIEKPSLEPSKSSISTSVDATEIIEIISDDEDDIPTTTSTHTGNSLVKNTLLATVSTNSPTISKCGSTTADPSPEVSTSTPYLSSTTVPQENLMYNTSVSIVKPDIRIKGNAILDSLDPRLSDVKLLKELLNIYRPLVLSIENSTQSELPKSSSISVINTSDATTELKNLKQHLFVYKIPIDIKDGIFNVSYDYHMEAKQPKKLCLWNDLTPTDIKINSVSVSNSSSKEQAVEDKSSENNAPNLPSITSGFNSSPVQITSTTQLALVADTSTNSSSSNACATPGTTLSTKPLSEIIPKTQNSSTSIQQSATTVTVPTSTTSSPPLLANSVPVGAIRMINTVPVGSIRMNNERDGSIKETGNNDDTTASSNICTGNSSTAPSIVTTNPLLNNFLETHSSSPVQPTTLAVVSTSSASNPSPLVSPIPIGSIRVKNVWELT